MPIYNAKLSATFNLLKVSRSTAFNKYHFRLLTPNQQSNNLS